MKWTEESMLIELNKAMDLLGIHRMPTSMELRENGMSGLSRAISLNGGMSVWAKKLGVHSKKRETIWNDERIKSELLRCIDILMLDRMPTAGELLSIGRNDLHVIVGRTKTYSGWAEELGISLKSCSTRKGQEFEKKAKYLIEEKGYEVELTTTRHPYDLLVEGSVKIDVKVGKGYLIGKSETHTFSTSKKQATCDLYILFAVDEEGRFKKTFVIPSLFVKQVTLSIGPKTQWNKYIDRWDYITQYVNFYRSIV
jgi:hypothetical protein